MVHGERYPPGGSAAYTTYIAEHPNVCPDLITRPPLRAAVVASLPVVMEDFHLCGKADVTQKTWDMSAVGGGGRAGCHDEACTKDVCTRWSDDEDRLPLKDFPEQTTMLRPQLEQSSRALGGQQHPLPRRVVRLPARGRV